MIELTDDALLGEPLAITVTQYADMRPYDYPGTWWADPKLSGGTFSPLGVHVIDWFRAMCADVESVCAMYGPQVEAGYQFPDLVHAMYRFQSGALATLNTSFMYPLQKFREAQGPMVQCRHGGMKLVPEMDVIHLHWQRPGRTGVATMSSFLSRMIFHLPTGVKSAILSAGSGRIVSHASVGWRDCAAWK